MRLWFIKIEPERAHKPTPHCRSSVFGVGGVHLSTARTSSISATMRPFLLARLRRGKRLVPDGLPDGSFANACRGRCHQWLVAAPVPSGWSRHSGLFHMSSDHSELALEPMRCSFGSPIATVLVGLSHSLCSLSRARLSSSASGVAWDACSPLLWSCSMGFGRQA